MGPVSARWLESTIVRRLHVPPGVATVCVGGATLGGSGKTPLAIACARALADRGHRVALVGHGHRGRPDHARVVHSSDALDIAGDEALVAAAHLLSHVPVVIAPRRQRAVELSAEHADVLVMDGVHQIHPLRATVVLLATSMPDPWGSGQPFPRGDLRASSG